MLLAASTGLTIIVGETFDLELEAVALLGMTAGAIVALVPDATPPRRLGAYALGFVAGLVSYLVRAGLMPDTSTGRAGAAFLAVLLCVGLVALSAGRLPLWAALLGAGSFAGAYEFTYAAAPPQVLDTSISTGTALGLCVAVGFLVTAWLSDTAEPSPPTRDAEDESRTRIDDTMEIAK
ncbi:hypothetical protein CF8_2518 [Nocardioides sp. CF8]|nr:hypothetical protein CF8_2518 [Nocardioides sp. CF8]